LHFGLMASQWSSIDAFVEDYNFADGESLEVR